MHTVYSVARGGVRHYRTIFACYDDLFSMWDLSGGVRAKKISQKIGVVIWKYP